MEMRGDVAIIRPFENDGLMRPESLESPAGPRAARLGLDLGNLETRIALPTPDGTQGPRLLSVPSAISYSPPEAEPIRFCCVGERALERRDHLRMLRPLAEDGKGRRGVHRDYAEKLRELFQKRSEPAPWGVLSLSAASPESENDAKRAVAGQLFERVVFVDDMVLVAVALTSLEISQHSIIIDIGHTSIRAALMYGVAPRPEDRVEVPFGGDRMNQAYRDAFALRYPELLFTGPTLERLRARFAFVAPERRRCLLEIKCRRSAKTIDVSDVVEEASIALLRPLLRAAREVLALCPSDEIEAFQRNVLLVGGGARMLGIGPRVEEELRADGFDCARVRTPESPEFVAARGAYLWAQSVQDDRWSIPLFSFDTSPDSLPCGSAADPDGSAE